MVLAALAPLGQHRTFGVGQHFCLGSHVAHSQMRAMFEQVLWRMEDLALAGEPERMISNFQSGFKPLPISWTVA